MCPPRLAMSHLPRLLLLLLIFLGIHDSASHGSPLPSTYDDSMCSEPSMCGSVEIAYPFYLSNATDVAIDNYTSYSCGYTDLMIMCQSEGETETPILRLGEDNYTVKNIVYKNLTIILADTDALRGGDCPRVRHNVTFGLEYWLHYTNSFDNLTFFLDCDLLTVAPEYQINCTGFNPPGTVSFVLNSEEHEIPLEYDLAGHCGQIFVVPVHEDVRMRSGQLMLPMDYGALLKQGFELAWNPSGEPRCYQCEQSKGRCAYSVKKEFFGCLCSGGKVGVQDCNSSGTSTASASTSSCPVSDQDCHSSGTSSSIASASSNSFRSRIDAL